MIDWPVKFVESKYSRWYELLIQSAQLRGTVIGYKEVHHIIPRSFGGSNDKSNLVQLTAREHYIAHALLWKMKFRGIYGRKMLFAFNTFANKMHSSSITYKVNSRLYESFKSEYAAMLSEKMQGEGNHFYGKTHSEETRRIIGEKSKLKEFKKGPDHPSWGKTPTVSPEGKANQLKSIAEMWNDPKRRAALLEKRAIALQTPESIAKRKAAADARRGVKRPEIVGKYPSPRKGKKGLDAFSAEALENIRNGIKNRVLTEDAKERMKAGQYKGCRMPKPEHWKKQVGDRFRGRTDMKGENNPNYGNKWSDEQRQRASERMKGNTLSLETIEKRKATNLARSKQCIHCDKIANPTNYVRWHGDNCKHKP